MSQDKPSRKALKKKQSERIKLASIPILLLVLAYVLFSPEDAPQPTPAQSPTQPVVVQAPAVAPAAPSSGLPSPGVPSPGLLSSGLLSSGLPSSAASGARPLAAPSTSHDWPDVDLAFLDSSNPFANYAAKADFVVVPHFVSNDPKPVEDAAINLLTSVAQELQQLPVNYVFQSERRKFVMLGEQVLEAGTLLSDAVRIQDISDEALVIELSSAHVID